MAEYNLDLTTGTLVPSQPQQPEQVAQPNAEEETQQQSAQKQGVQTDVAEPTQEQHTFMPKPEAPVKYDLNLESGKLEPEVRKDLDGEDEIAYYRKHGNELSDNTAGASKDAMPTVGQKTDGSKYAGMSDDELRSFVSTSTNLMEDDKKAEYNDAVSELKAREEKDNVATNIVQATKNLNTNRFDEDYYRKAVAKNYKAASEIFEWCSTKSAKEIGAALYKWATVDVNTRNEEQVATYIACLSKAYEEATKNGKVKSLEDQAIEMGILSGKISKGQAEAQKKWQNAELGYDSRNGGDAITEIAKITLGILDARGKATNASINKQRREDAWMNVEPGESTIMNMRLEAERLKGTDITDAFQTALSKYGMDKLGGYVLEYSCKNHLPLNAAWHRVLEQIKNDIVTDRTEKQIPHDNGEYFLKHAFGDTMWGQLFKAGAKVMSGTQGHTTEYDLSAGADYKFAQTHKSTWDTAVRIAAGVTPFVLDSLAGGFFMPSQAAKWTTLGFTRVAGSLMSAGSKLTADAALRVASQKLGFKVAQSVLSGAVNFGTYEMQSALLGSAQLESGVSLDYVCKRGLEGFGKGAIFGTVGSLVGEATSGLTGKLVWAGEGLKAGAEAGTFVAFDALSLPEGEKLTPEMIGSAIGMTIASRFTHGKQYLADVKSRMDGTYKKCKVNMNRITDADAKELTDMGYPEMAKMMRYKAISNDGMEKLAQEYEKMVNDNNVPLDYVRRAAWVVDGKLMPSAVALDVEATYNTGGTYEVNLYDSNGRKINGTALVTKDELLVDALQHEARINRIKLCADNVTQQDQFGVIVDACREYATSTGVLTNQEVFVNYKNAIDKIQRGEALSEPERNLVKGVNENLKDKKYFSSTNHIRIRIKNDYNVDINKVIDKPYDKLTSEEKKALNVYEAAVKTMVEDVADESYFETAHDEANGIRWAEEIVDEVKEQGAEEVVESEKPKEEVLPDGETSGTEPVEEVVEKTAPVATPAVEPIKTETPVEQPKAERKPVGSMTREEAEATYKELDDRMNNGEKLTDEEVGIMNEIETRIAELDNPKLTFDELTELAAQPRTEEISKTMLDNGYVYDGDKKAWISNEGKAEIPIPKRSVEDLAKDHESMVEQARRIEEQIVGIKGNTKEKSALKKQAEELYERISDTEEELDENGASDKYDRFEAFRPVRNKSAHAVAQDYEQAEKNFAKDKRASEELHDTEPRNAYEYITTCFKGVKLLFKDNGNVKGVASHAGVKWNDVKGLAFLFSNKEGIGLKRFAEQIWEDMPEQFRNELGDDLAVRDIVIDILKSSKTPGDIHNTIKANRIETAREIFENNGRTREEVEQEEWDRIQYENEQERKKAAQEDVEQPSDTASHETTGHKDAKLQESSFDPNLVVRDEKVKNLEQVNGKATGAELVKVGIDENGNVTADVKMTFENGKTKTAKGVQLEQVPGDTVVPKGEGRKRNNVIARLIQKVGNKDIPENEKTLARISLNRLGVKLGKDSRGESRKFDVLPSRENAANEAYAQASRKKENMSSVDRKAKEFIEDKLGYKIEIVPELNAPDGGGLNGRVNFGNKTIYISQDADYDRSLRWVLGHEVEHAIKKADAKAYEAFKNAVEDYYRYFEEKYGEEGLQEIVKRRQDLEGWNEVEGGYDDALEEVVSDMAGRLFDNADFAREVMGRIAPKYKIPLITEALNRIKDWIEKKVTGIDQWRKLETTWRDMLQQAIEERSPKSDIENDIITESEGKNSRRKKPAPEETRKVYKLMRLLPDGKLQTLFIGRETYELGKWYDADAPGMDVLEKQKQDYFYLFDENNNIVDSRPIKYGKSNRISGLSKKDIETANENNQRWVAVGRYANGGRKYANMGINGAEGVTDYAMRPGIHAGSLPVMTQIGSGSTRDIRDNNLVWVEGEVAYGNGAPEEAASNGGEITTHIPVDGGYEKGTSSFVTKGMNWYISGAFLPKRIMGDIEAREVIDKFNQENGGNVPHDFMRRDGKVFNAETMQLEDAPEGWKESYNDGKGKNSRKDFSIAFSRYIPKTKEEKISTIKQLIEIAKTVKGRVVRRIVDIVTDRQIQDLKKKGLDIDSSYVHSIENSSINHSESRHGGKSTPRGNYVALTESDYELIPDILNDYDSIEVSSNKNKVGNTVIEYEKELPDGTIMYLEEVRTGRKSLALQTMYKIKKGTDSSDGLLHSATTTTPKAPSDNFNSDSKDTTNSSTVQEDGKNSRKGADLYRDKEEYKEGEVLDIKTGFDGYTTKGMTMPYNHPERLLEAWRNKHPNYYAFLTDDKKGIEVYPVEGGKTRLEALYGKARSSKQRQQYVERKAKMMQDRALETGNGLGVKVNVIEPGTETDADRLKSKGWYDTKTGEINVVLGNHTDEWDVRTTVLREAVANHGLRKYVGEENYNEWLQEVYNTSLNDVKKRINEIADKQGISSAEATEEYLANLAEDMSFTDEHPSWWSRVKSGLKDLIQNILDKDKANDGTLYTFSDNDLRYILWSSYNHLKMDAEQYNVTDAEVRKNLGVGQLYAAEDGDVKFSRKRPLEDSEETRTRREKALAYTAEQLRNETNYHENAVARIEQMVERLRQQPIRPGRATAMMELRNQLDSAREALEQARKNETGVLESNPRDAVREWNNGGLYTKSEMLIEKTDAQMRIRDILGGVADIQDEITQLEKQKRKILRSKKTREEIESLTEEIDEKIASLKERLGEMRRPENFNEEEYLDLNRQQADLLARKKEIEKGKTTARKAELLTTIDSELSDLRERREKMLSKLSDKQKADLVREETRVKLATTRLQAMDDLPPMIPNNGERSFKKATGVGDMPQEIDYAVDDSNIYKTLPLDDPTRIAQEQDFERRVEEAQHRYHDDKNKWFELHGEFAEAWDKYKTDYEEWAARQRGYRNTIMALENKLSNDAELQNWSARSGKGKALADKYVTTGGIDLSAQTSASLLRDMRYDHRRIVEHAMGEDALTISGLKTILKEKVADKKERKAAEKDLIAMLQGTKETPEHLKQTVQLIRDWFEDMFQWQMSNGMTDYTKHRKNYVPQIWDMDKSRPDADAQTRLENYDLKGTSTESAFMNQRVYDTYEEGIEHGLVPKYESIFDLMRVYGAQVNKSIANKQYINMLRAMRMGVESKVKVDGEWVKTIVHVPVIIEEGESSNKQDYRPLQNTAFYRDGKPQYLILRPKDKDSSLFLSEVRATLGESEEVGKVGAFFDRLSSVMKGSMLKLSFFHHVALTEHYMGLYSTPKGSVVRSAWNILADHIARTAMTGKTAVERNPEDAMEARTHFVKFGESSDYDRQASDIAGLLHQWIGNGSNKLWQDYQNAKTDAERETTAKEILKGVFGLTGKTIDVVPAVISTINKYGDRFLWEVIHDGFKLDAYRELKRRVMKQAEKEGWDETRINKELDECGQRINDMYGGQHWDLLKFSPKLNKMLRRVMLSPDWNVSWTRLLAGTTGMGKLYNESEGNMAKRFIDGRRFFKRGEDGKIHIVESEGATAQKASALVTILSALRVGVAWSILNYVMRKKDEEEQMNLAEKIRNGYTDENNIVHAPQPEYKTPYERAGVKPDDWTGDPLGTLWKYALVPWNTLNDPGKGTYLFIGRDESGRSRYIRWGKQMREAYALGYNEYDVFDPVGSLAHEAINKANPVLGSVFLVMTGRTLNGWESKDMKYKEGLDLQIERAKLALLAFAPMSIGRGEDLDAWNMFLPKSKGLSSWTATERMTRAMLRGDDEEVKRIKRACLMNGVDYTKVVQTAQKNAEMENNDPVTKGLDNPEKILQKYNETTDPGERMKLERKYKTMTATFEQSLDDVVEGAKEKVSKNPGFDKYKSTRTSSDFEEDWIIERAAKSIEDAGVVTGFNELGGKIHAKDGKFTFGKENKEKAKAFYEAHKKELRVIMAVRRWDAKLKKITEDMGKDRYVDNATLYQVRFERQRKIGELAAIARGEKGNWSKK